MKPFHTVFILLALSLRLDLAVAHNTLSDAKSAKSATCQWSDRDRKLALYDDGQQRGGHGRYCIKTREELERAIEAIPSTKNNAKRTALELQAATITLCPFTVLNVGFGINVSNKVVQVQCGHGRHGRRRGGLWSRFYRLSCIIENRGSYEFRPMFIGVNSHLTFSGVFFNNWLGRLPAIDLVDSTLSIDNSAFARVRAGNGIFGNLLVHAGMHHVTAAEYAQRTDKCQRNQDTKAAAKTSLVRTIVDAVEQRLFVVGSLLVEPLALTRLAVWLSSLFWLPMVRYKYPTGGCWVTHPFVLCGMLVVALVSCLLLLILLLLLWGILQLYVRYQWHQTRRTGMQARRVPIVTQQLQALVAAAQQAGVVVPQAPVVVVQQARVVVQQARFVVQPEPRRRRLELFQIMMQAAVNAAAHSAEIRPTAAAAA